MKSTEGSGPSDQEGRQRPRLLAAGRRVLRVVDAGSLPVAYDRLEVMDLKDRLNTL